MILMAGKAVIEDLSLNGIELGCKAENS